MSVIFFPRHTTEPLFCSMTNINDVQLDQVIIHKVGNPTRGEELKLSTNSLTLNDEIVRGMLTKYFLSPFNEHEQYQFTHLSSLELNEVYQYVSGIFDDPKSFVSQSALLASFLYNKSTHARVKEGELYVARLVKFHLDQNILMRLVYLKVKPKKHF